MDKLTKNKNVILHIDPRGVIFSGGKDVIERQKKYARQLASLKYGSDLDLNIFSSSSSSFLQSDINSNFELNNLSKPNLNFVSFAFRSVMLCKEKKLNVKLIIVGDPWESFICAKIIRIFLFKFVPIQVHIHADIGNPTWVKLGWQNKLRLWWARLSLKRVDAIRTVGYHQTWNIINSFNIEKSRISIIPIPINNLRLTSSLISKRPKALALIGRIHDDRGVYDFIRLIKSLTGVRDDFTVVIAGGGPDEKRFVEEIKELLPQSRIKFLGYLTENELKKIWRKIGVLVSTAPAESYGRVMREALVAGVPVWATKSSGVEDLISKAGKNAVRILDLSKSSHELNVELDKLLNSKISLNFRKQFIKDNSTYAQLLAKSWVDLINKQKS